MTDPSAGPPLATLPPPPDPPPWPGPSAWPRPPRWLGLGTIARLTARSLRTRRLATGIGVVTGLVAGAALAGAFGAGDRSIGRQLAALILLVGGAALADTTDPDERDDAALLLRLGCPRLVVRLSAWAGSVVALGIPAALAAQVARWIREASPEVHLPGVGNMAGLALLLVGAGAVTTSGTRLTERRDASSAGAVWRVLRIIASIVLIILGALFPSTSDSGTTLDFTLFVGLLFVLVGLVGLAPALVGAAVRVARWVPWAPARVASATLAPQRKGLTLAVSLAAGLAALLVVQVTVGSGLGARERARVAAVRALGPATVAGSDRVVVVDRDMERSLGGDPTAPIGSPSKRLADVLPDGATSAPVRLLAAEAGAAGGVLGDVAAGSQTFFGDDWGSVALATPELLAALGLDPGLATGDEALVLDRRVLGAGSQVRLEAADNADAIGTDPGPGVTRPGRFVASGAAWTGVPPVLLPQGMYDGLPAAVRRPRPGDFATAPSDRVIRYPARPTEAQLEDLYRVFPDGDVERGSERVDLARSSRTDKTSIIWVRDGADVRELAVTLGAMAALALGAALVSLRLAVRREEAVLGILGARRRTLVAVGAVRGAALAAVAAVVGAAIALVSTWWGLHWYDSRTRVRAQVVLAPIGWHLPASAIVALLALPLLAAAIGGVLGLLGPPRPSGRGARRAA